MKKSIILLFTLIGYFTNAQSLSVEKIMQDPKWIGNSPSNAFWGPDSKTVYFNWNPQKNISDSVYAYSLTGGAPQKTNILEVQKINSINAAVYNNAQTQYVYVYRGDIYWVEVKTNKTTRVTQTEEFESGAKFIMNDEWIVFNKNQNLFGWNTKTGITLQLTNITRSAEIAAPAAFAGRGNGGGGF